MENGLMITPCFVSNKEGAAQLELCLSRKIHEEPARTFLITTCNKNGTFLKNWVENFISAKIRKEKFEKRAISAGK